MTTITVKDGSLVFDLLAAPTRKCGDCTLCCRLLPVRELAKRGNERCQFQRHGKGCTIYHQPSKGFPLSCAVWSCVWLSDPDAGAIKRPDHGHYVVDPMPDVIIVQNDGEPEARFNVVQVWIDPAYPDAHRDAGLREYLALRGARDNFAALIRFNETDSFVLFPPAMTPDGKFHERGSRVCASDTDVVVPEGSLRK